MDTIGICGFCGKRASLRESHVLPAFVYRWLRARSGTGHIRKTDDPNRRIQDGLKLKWLCDQCESRFSRFETAFATKVFHPWHDGAVRIAYETWLLKFCVSVSWRVLRYTYGRNQNPSYTLKQRGLVDRAEQHWRAFLNDEVPNPGEFEQHLLIFDNIESATATDLPQNFNRFMTGAITFDIIGSSQSLMTFAKLGRFTIFGIIQKGPNEWEGTKVHVRQGLLKPGNFTVPGGLLHLFRDKAVSAAAAMEAMSSTQQEKVDTHIRNNIEQFRESDQFASIAADARMFGEDAVIWKK